MNWWQRIRSGFLALFRKEQLDREMDEEMRVHIELRTLANIEAGMKPDEARHAAMRGFGGMEQIKEVCRDLRGVGWIETMWQDVRFGWRMLRKNPGFTVVAATTLALAIGANTAIFTLVNALLLRALPGVRAPHDLVLVTDSGSASLGYPLYKRFCDENRSFGGLFAASGNDKRRMVVSGSDGVETEPVWAQAVSGSFFEVLGVPAATGRTFTLEDDRPSDPQAVAVISHAFWQRRFGPDPTVIGKRITLDEIPFTIVGVAPEGFFGFEVGETPELWWPIQMHSQVVGGMWKGLLEDEGSWWLRVMGRLKAGVPVEQARAELDVMFRRMLDGQAVKYGLTGEERRRFLARRIELEAGGAGYSGLRQTFEKPMLILTAAAGLVLLVACANLAGLLLARGASRQRELCVRGALGAGRLSLIRQLMTESLLLSVLGGALGLLLAQWGVRLLADYIPGYGETVLLRLAPDTRILAFTFIVSALTGVLFGVVPALRGSRLDLATAIKDQTGSLMGSESGQLWNKALVVCQIALSCCLLIGAGLFVRTVQRLRALDVGFKRENLLVFSVDVGKEYDDTQRANLHHEVLRCAENLPGVWSASSSTIRSLSGSEWGWGPGKVVVEGQAPNPEEGMEVRGTGVGLRYFETMGIPLVRGRDFGPQDAASAGAGLTDRAPRPVIIDESAARRLFGNANPVGRLLRAAGGSPSPPFEVVGVAGNVIHKGLRSGTRISIYGLETQRQCPFFFVRTVGNPLAVADSLRRLVHELDPRAEVSDLRTMRELVDEQLLRERTLSELAGFFSLLAMVLACLGLYGVLSYGVVRRTREIGVRMALGARARDVLGLVIRQGMTLTLAGCALGIVLAMALTRLVASLLYGVTATDPTTFAGVLLALTAVALLACWLPARRAARVDPMVALRYE